MLEEPHGGRFLVEGGHAIEGTFAPSGNKNEALPTLAASLLSEGTVTYANLPDIRDVTTLLELLESLGASVRRTGSGQARVDTGGELSSQPDPLLAAQ